MRDAHARGADNQAPPDVMMEPKYTDKVAETGCGDSKKVHSGELQYHGGGRRGVF